MPGKIESIPFFSQLEDVDKYLLEYRSLKLASPASGGYESHAPSQHQQMHGQVRYGQGNVSGGNYDNDVGGNEVAIQAGSNGKPLQAENCQGINSGVAFSNSGKGSSAMGGAAMNGNMGLNRKRVMGAGNQGYRYNGNAGMKYGVQYQPGKQQQNHQQQHNSSAYAASSMISNHLKQVYPQMSYNANGSGSNLALDQLSSSFMVPNQHKSQQQQQQQQQGYPSSNSSPSPVPPSADAALSGSSSISSFSSNIGYVLPPASGSSNSHFAAQAPFSNYLDSGLVSTTPIAPGNSSAANVSASSGADMTSGYPSASLASSASNATASAFDYESSMPTPTLLSETISTDQVAPSTRENTLASFEGSNNNSGSNMLMNDYSIGWGSNHANSSSSAGGSFGIWNNDMSVWS